ncbi:MAG: amino acid adenylation domain-containing protein, partial [Akkermansiaceae bacterium]|nr:amino acid adenylation domain-containing protein [Akkermansiaceae bacterium]
PTDFPRPAIKSWKGEIISTLLPKELTDQLQAIAAKQGSTLFHLQLAAYMILLHRYTGSFDVAVGTPVTGRTRGELESLIGVFINSLILRCDLTGNPGFSSFLGKVRDTALEALENQELPFECLVRELRPERDQSRNPLFQVNFNHHRSFAQAGSFGGVTLTPIPSRSPGTIFDLHFFMVERKEGWRASCDYSTDLFTRTSAERMLGHYKRLLENIAAHPEKPIAELEILTDAEKKQIADCSIHNIPYPREATIGSLFLETADRFAKRTAFESGDQQFTYLQLRNDASALAARLIESGVKPGDCVAISSHPGPEMILGVVAIVLAGGCCVPMDPAYPADRFAMLLDECGARHALAGDGCAAAYPSAWKGRIHAIPAMGEATASTALPAVSVTADTAAQLLFTSGSTGRPKGVLLPHRGTVRLVRNNDFIPITSEDVFVQTAPLAFDASLLEIWGTLLNGGRLVLLPKGPGLGEIAHAVKHRGVTTLWLTSGLFQLMIDEHADALKGIRYLVTGGEVISTSHVKRTLDSLPGTQLVHAYGPTENTTFTTCHSVQRTDLERTTIPIGKPVANTSVHLLDEQLRSVPIGIPGELFTGGDGLAIGYLNAPELTAEKFIEHPSLGRLYRTGDMCRRAADGNIEFIGRRDHQVKVRGFRIELGEIEAILSDHPQVRQCKAAVRGDSTQTKRIFAWVVPVDQAKLGSAELITYLSERLPGFMQPDGIAVIDSFPLNANGKIHVAALADPGSRMEASNEKAYEAPAGRVEERLAEIWQELLGRPQVSRHDDFFALGGHSLMALRMFSRINREFDKSLPLATLLQNPTIARLATQLVEPVVIEEKPIAKPLPASAPSPTRTGKGNIVTLAEGGNQHPLFCIHGGDGGVLFYRGLAALMPKDLPFHAIESLELGNSGKIEACSIEDTAAAYVANLLKVQSSGPFRLAGYSFGGVVAHEMACQLTKLGHKVEFLGLFDTHNPAAPARAYSMGERLRVFWQQSAGEPFFTRIGQLRARIGEGIRTNRRVKAELAAAAAGPADAYSDLRRVQVREENWRAMQAYRPAPFPGRITLFKTSHVNDKVERPADYGWAELASSGLDIVSVSGHHLALFASEHIGTLAEALTRSLKRSAATTT